MNDIKNGGWEQWRDFILSLPESLQPAAVDDAWSCMTAGLIKSYLLAAGEVRNDKRRGPKVRRANLQRLLPPILLIQKAHSIRLRGKEKENPYRINNRSNSRSYFPFIADDHINTKEEIDLSKLHYNRKKYFIDPHSFCGEFFDTISARITLYDVPESKEARLTFHNCYLRKLPMITQDTMKSTDLLEQLIVTYTIKQALNGDTEARSKLIELYVWKAMKEIRIALKNREEKGLPVPQFNSRDLSREFLDFLLGGLYQPEDLIKYLQSETVAERSQFPLWTEKFFIWYFVEYLPPYLESVAQNPGSVDPDNVMAMMSPYSLIHAGLRWKHPQYKYARRFLSYCYRPQKDLNLTTWLFAPFPYGRFRLLLQERINEEEKPKGLILQTINDGQDDPPSQEEYLDSLNKKDPWVEPPEEPYFFQSTIDALLKKAEKKPPQRKIGFKRNVQIYRQNKKEGYDQRELAQMHGLSRRQIIRIIKQIDKEVKRIEKN